MTTIHETAVVDPSAEIAESASIGPYCVIGPEVVIGERTALHNHVSIQSLTTIGDDNEIFPFAVLGADPQDRKYKGERTTCVVGDRNIIREQVTLHRGTGNGGFVTTVGNDNLIMGSVHIAHDCRIGNGCTIANQALLAGHVLLEDNANIGGGAGVHHFATVGTCSFVSAMARVGKDVPPYLIVEGNPAAVRGVNTIAMTRSGLPGEHIEAIKDAFKRLYRDNGAAIADKLDELRRDYAAVPAIAKLCSALVASADGVHGRARELGRPDDKRELLKRPVVMSLK